MTKEELQKILENHSHWINRDVDGWENMKAVLYGADLHRAVLYGADLHRAVLCGADLHKAVLYGADLRCADLRCADLRCADLRCADLHRAVLCGANLNGANLNGADLNGANLNGANLNGAKHLPYIPMVCPEEGECIGWKKAGAHADKIVKLLIPADAKRSSSTTRKCRCSKAKVLEIYNLDGTVAEEREIESNRDTTFVYRVGETVEVSDFDDDRWNECSTGIHFFVNRQEAINYEL